MAYKTTETCDRCKEEMKWSLFPKGRLYRRKLTWILGHNPYDYSDRYYDLCFDCSQKLEKFMKGDKS